MLHRVSRWFYLTLSMSLLILLGSPEPAAAGNPTPAGTLDVFTVNSAADNFDGSCTVESCTLRAAILAANANPGMDTIHFAIPGDGPHTITVVSRLPRITQPLTIDGSTQPGYTGTPLVELDGSQPLDSGHGLELGVGADNSSIKGLAITGFRLEGINLFSVDNVSIQDNYIGVGADGETPRGNGGSGVGLLEASSNNILDNVIGANDNDGIRVQGQASQNNVIARNFIGSNRAGADLGNGEDGILAVSSGPQIIGGTYGDSGCCEGNVIAYNAGRGVTISAGANASYEKGILGNRIYANGELGIDLQRDGVTENDPDDSDGDGLGNRLQNFPVLEAAHVEGAIAITGTLTTRADSDFRIEFFANDACDPSGYGQGQRYLGGAYVTSGGNGVAAFSEVFTDPFDPAAAGDFITSTATDVDGNTSEFSACLQASGSTVLAGVAIYLPALLSQSDDKLE